MRTGRIDREQQLSKCFNASRKIHQKCELETKLQIHKRIFHPFSEKTQGTIFSIS